MNMTIDLTEIVLAVLTIIGGIISTQLIPYLREKYTKEQLERANTYAQIAVNAVEQLMKSGVIKPEERKQKAMEMLAAKNIKLDLDQLEEMVEAWVLKLPKSFEEDTNVE